MNSELFPVRATTAPHARPEQVIRHGHYRFSILKDGVVRIEFNPEHRYTDAPTQTIWFRDCGTVPFKVDTTTGVWTLTTSRLKLEVFKPEELHATAFAIQSLATGFIWHLGEDDEALPGTARTLDGADGKTPLSKGVVSRNGIAVLDDHDSLLLDRNLWPTHRPAVTDLYVFVYGHDYAAALDAYYELSGRTPLIPRYVLGNWWSKYWAYKDSDLLAIADRFAAEYIPLSVIIVDMDWHITAIPGVQDYWAGWTGYTVNQEFFPDYSRFINDIHQRGLRTSVNLHPAGGVKPYEKQYSEFCQAVNADPTLQETIAFDSADALQMKAYFEVLLHPYEEQGVDFWWIDWQQGNTSKTPGLDPLWMLNHLHFFDAARQIERRPFTFSRWSGKGAQRYPIGFSGDTHVTWNSLQYQPFFTATAANIGFGHWSHDIGGHMAGIEDPELYTRWVQFGCFSPILRLHSCSNLYAIREPWRYEAPYRSVISDFMRLRGRLIPYLYTAAYENFADNRPLIRPLYYAAPEIDAAYHAPNTYLFGSELVVHAVTHPMDPVSKRTLETFYLPPGSWTNFFTGEQLEGDKEHTVPFALDEQGVYARAGAIIPLDGSPIRNGAPAPTHLELHVFAGESGAYTLYEDDGLSNKYLANQAFFTTLTYTEHNGHINFRIVPQDDRPDYLPTTRSYTVFFHGVTAEGEHVQPFDHGVYVHLDESPLTTDHTITLTHVLPIDRRIATWQAIEKFLISMTLNHGEKTAIHEAFHKFIQKAPIQRTYSQVDKAYKIVLNAYLQLLYPIQHHAK